MEIREFWITFVVFFVMGCFGVAAGTHQLFVEEK